MTLHAIALHQPVTVRGLAIVLAQDRNRVSITVGQLVAAGLVQRERADLKVTLQLTSTGWQALDADSAGP